MWLRDDLEIAVMWQQEKASACPGCGLPRDETQDKARQGGYRAKARRCFACQAAGAEARRFTSGPHDPDGINYVIEPIED